MPLAFILLLGLLLGLTSAAPMPSGALARSRASGHLSARPAPRPALVGIVTHGSRNSPWVALTFDTDMTPGIKSFQVGRKGVLNSNLKPSDD
jgi:hypothetical protein